MDAKLIVIGGKANKSEVKLKLPSSIGRSRSADLTVQHPKVSRIHCEIFERDGALVVRDNGSLNGTYVENRRVTEAVLRPGDKLTVGPLTFVAVYEHTGDFPQVAAPAARNRSTAESEFDTPDFKATAPDAPNFVAPAVSAGAGLGGTLTDGIESDWLSDEEPAEAVAIEPAAPVVPAPPAKKKPAVPAAKAAAPPPLEETIDFGDPPVAEIAAIEAINITPVPTKPAPARPAKDSSQKAPKSPAAPAIPSAIEPQLPLPPASPPAADEESPPSDLTVDMAALADQPLAASAPVGTPEAADDENWLDEESDPNLAFASASHSGDGELAGGEPVDEHSGQTLQQPEPTVTYLAGELPRLEASAPGGATAPEGDEFDWLNATEAPAENPLFGLSAQMSADDLDVLNSPIAPGETRQVLRDDIEEQGASFEVDEAEEAHVEAPRIDVTGAGDSAGNPSATDQPAEFNFGEVATSSEERDEPVDSPAAFDFAASNGPNADPADEAEGLPSFDAAAPAASRGPTARATGKKKGWWPFGGKKPEAKAAKPQKSAAQAVAVETVEAAEALVETEASEAEPEPPQVSATPGSAPEADAPTQFFVPPAAEEESAGTEASNDDDLNQFFKSLG